ncbi:MAG: hypothetical protein QXR19_14905 [Candidatus Jordarchaeaceae archaeon]
MCFWGAVLADTPKSLGGGIRERAGKAARQRGGEGRNGEKDRRGALMENREKGKTSHKTKKILKNSKPLPPRWWP